MIKDGGEEQVRAGLDLSAQVLFGAFSSASPEMCSIVWNRGPCVHGERFGTGGFMPCRESCGLAACRAPACGHLLLLRREGDPHTVQRDLQKSS